ncbi:MAG: hypothetical protein LC667_06905 [Thioalkalivibrio sp.]|nr:hypothetical protein [Thioalkalivibrio sp.]
MRRHRPMFMVLVALALVAPHAYSQSVSHPLTVTMPSYIGLRIVGTSAAGPRSVMFDYASDTVAYLAAAAADQPLMPTSVARFDDVEVNVVGFGRWSVYVEATAFDYTGQGTGSGLALDDVRMARGSASGLSQNAINTALWLFGAYSSAWTLSTAPQRIARSWIGTGGWRSLGFNGWDYTLTVDGDEDAGTYSTTVTYFLTFP